MLAVAAIHLHVSQPDPGDYRRLAQDHHSQALAYFRAALSSPSAGNEALALFACSALMSTYYFAAFDDPSCLLFSSDSLMLPEWMLPVRGCAAVLCQFRDQLGKTDMEDLLKAYSRFWTDTPLHREECVWDSPLSTLQLRLRALVGHNSHALHEPALQLLRRCFVLSDQNPGLSSKAVAAMTFPSIVSVDFLEAVSKQKSPAALAIMAFWCVLLSKVEDKYWLREENVPRVILRVIISHVEDEYLDLIDWPLEVLGFK
ncbi:hypothetical protein NM208_g5285 [Fusarium decemcellulare]|uniref:Uncharacterized protein n=1 Tax=Fusarium decemcellulare TaxID=57161 RepID=A0ACC1SHK8_9HYPO|nr:hypothetical protein NM208_g5285 [Fusarium decemcellulare]